MTDVEVIIDTLHHNGELVPIGTTLQLDPADAETLVALGAVRKLPAKAVQTPSKEASKATKPAAAKAGK